MSRDVDIQCAKAAGWTDIRDDYYAVPESIWYGKPPVMPSWESPDHKAKGISLVPHFSTRIADAMTLVKHLTTEDEWGDIKMAFSLSYTNVIGWKAAFLPRKGSVYEATNPDEPAAAIARAFLETWGAVPDANENQ